MKKVKHDIRNIYTTPSGYFEKLPSEVMQRIRSREQKSKRVIVPPVVRLAAIILLIAGTAFASYFLVDPRREDTMAQLEQVEEEEIIAWLSIRELTTHDVLAVVDNDALPGDIWLEEAKLPQDISIEELDLEDVEYYLNNTQ